MTAKHSLFGLDAHDRDGGFCITVQHCVHDGRRASPARQQRGVDVQDATGDIMNHRHMAMTMALLPESFVHCNDSMSLVLVLIICTLQWHIDSMSLVPESFADCNDLTASLVPESFVHCNDSMSLILVLIICTLQWHIDSMSLVPESSADCNDLTVSLVLVLIIRTLQWQCHWCQNYSQTQCKGITLLVPECFRHNARTSHHWYQNDSDTLQWQCHCIV